MDSSYHHKRTYPSLFTIEVSCISPHTHTALLPLETKTEMSLGYGCRFMIENLPSMPKTSGSIPSTAKRKRKKKKERQGINGSCL
jgi:hypothetical protein